MTGFFIARLAFAFLCLLAFSFTAQAQSNNSLCATVGIEIKQELTLEWRDVEIKESRAEG